MTTRQIRGLAAALLLGLCIASNATAQANRTEEADQLTQQATQLQQQGDYEGGIAAAERALQIRQQVLGEHPQTAASLLTLGDLQNRCLRSSRTVRVGGLGNQRSCLWS